MPTEALTCPSCGANDSSRGDAQGLHSCVYCGVRYRITGGHPQTLGPAGAPKPMTRPQRRAAIATGAIGAATLVIGVALVAGTKPTPRQIDVRVDPVTLPAPATPPDLVPVSNPIVEATPVIVEAPEPEAPAVATFVMDHRRPSHASTFYAAGFVTNESPYTIERPKITAVMKDASGAEVATTFGFADDVIAAGGKQGVQVLVMEPPPFATIEFEIAAKKATYISAGIEGLTIKPGPIEPAKFGDGFRVAGMVMHGGTVPARFVHVRALAFDGAGKLLGVDHTYADAEVLQPNATARWDISTQPFGSKPVRWEFSVKAMKAE